MRTEPSFGWHGLAAALLMVLVLGGSVSPPPARTDASPAAGATIPAAPLSAMLGNAGPAPVNAILPAGVELPAPPFEWKRPDRPAGTYEAQHPALGPFLLHLAPGAARLAVSGFDGRFPRYVFLHVYRC